MEEEISNWWKQAKHDLKSAEYNLEGNRLDVAAFLSQQTVEKSLKALYIQKYKKLKKTHSISILGKELELSDSLLRKISTLEPVYQRTRYPDVSQKIPAEEFTLSDVQDFVNIAEEVLSWIEKKLKL
ncbi:HEPN domain-containing protein [Candidatus Pacearchaeota archaeon]|nr:HEPN domain-containing protein [Candidatus Pacearchaeota archaeon]